MEKEVSIIISITQGERCALGLTAITVDTEAENIPSAVKEAETLTFNTKEFEHKFLEGLGHKIILHGDFNRDEAMKVRFEYLISRDQFKELNEPFINENNTDSDNELDIRMLKLLVDNNDPMIFIEFA